MPVLGAFNLGIQLMATQRNATQRNATQRNATQRNATQRNATQRNGYYFVLCCSSFLFWRFSPFVFLFPKFLQKRPHFGALFRTRHCRDALLPKCGRLCGNFLITATQANKRYTPFNRLIKEVHETQKRFCPCASLIGRCVIG